MGLQNSGNFFITEEFSSSFVPDRKIKCFQCELVVGLFDHTPVQEMAPNSFWESNFILRVLHVLRRSQYDLPSMNATGEKLTTHGSTTITHKDPQTKALLVQGISSEGKPQKKKSSTSAITHEDIPLKNRSQQGLRQIVPKRKPEPE